MSDPVQDSIEKIRARCIALEEALKRVVKARQVSHCKHIAQAALGQK